MPVAVVTNQPRKSVAVGLGALEVGVFLYYVAFAAYAWGVLMGSTSWVLSGYGFIGAMTPCIKFVSFLLLSFKILVFQKQGFTQWIVVAVLSLLGVVSYVVTGNPAVLALVLFVAAAKDVNYRALAGIMLVLNLLVFCTAVLGCWMGLFADFAILRDDGAVRHSLGFGHPNAFGLCLTSACVSFFMLRGERIGVIDAIVGAACCLLIVVVSDSRTAALGMTLAYLFFFAYARYKEKGRQHAVSSVLVVIAIAVVVLSFYSMVAFDSSNLVVSKLDDVLTGRLYWAHFFFERYSPGIFGQDVGLLPAMYFNNGDTVTTFVVDNAFAHFYLHYGPVCCCVLLVALVSFFWNAGKNGKGGVVLVGIAFAAVYGFAESSFLDPEFNYFMVVGLSWLLYGFPNDERLLSGDSPYRKKATYAFREKPTESLGAIGIS